MRCCLFTVLPLTGCLFFSVVGFAVAQEAGDREKPETTLQASQKLGEKIKLLQRQMQQIEKRYHSHPSTESLTEAFTRANRDYVRVQDEHQALQDSHALSLELLHKWTDLSEDIAVASTNGFAARLQEREAERRQKILRYELEWAKLRLEHEGGPVHQALDADPQLEMIRTGPTHMVESLAETNAFFKLPYDRARERKRAVMPEVLRLETFVRRAEERIFGHSQSQSVARLEWEKIKTRTRYSDDDRVVALREQYHAQRQETQKILKTDPEIQAASQAMEKAQEAIKEQVMALAQADLEYRKLQEEINQLENDRKEIEQELIPRNRPEP